MDDMAAPSPLFGEEIVDRRDDVVLFQGKEDSTATARVVLHALDGEGQSFCGLNSTDLTPIPRQWDAGYLPHLPRCGDCAEVVRTGRPVPPRTPGHASPGEPPSGLPATTVDVRTANDTDSEKAGAEALRGVLAEHDLRRWMFTDLVLVDESIRGGFSHPLTLNPGRLTLRPATALSTFLHEQSHWLQVPGLDAATTEVSKRWPDPPPLPAGGHNTESSWLHLSVCSLEYFSLIEVIGADAATAELRQQRVYAWMYGLILADPDWFAGLLERHDLHVPDEPRVPRRYCGEKWWTNLV